MTLLASTITSLSGSQHTTDGIRKQYDRNDIYNDVGEFVSYFSTIFIDNLSLEHLSFSICYIDQNL